MKRKIKYEKYAEMGLNLFYPHRCPICHQVLKRQKNLICQKCFRKLIPIGEPKCKKCGRPVLEEKELCRDCETGKRYFDEGRGIYPYTQTMKKSVLLYKYDGRREYSRFFAAAMSEYGKKELLRWKPDLIIPIPLHEKKRKQRGFNQAALLGEQLGRYTGLYVSDRVLKKKLQTKSQKKLDAKGRKKNLKHAFAVEEDVTGLRILLVDDVFTTGSTMDAAASSLKKAGASEVFFLTLCIAVTG